MATILQFTPEVVSVPAVVASDVSAAANAASPQPALVMTPVVTFGGSPVTPTALVLDSAPSNGVASVSGGNLIYQGNPGFVGSDSFTYHALTADGTSNVATARVRLADTCDELGRTTRLYVSGYTLARPAVSRVRRMAKRCVVANFNGALPTGRQIVSVRWETTSPWAIFMSNPRISLDQRQSMLDVVFNFAGWGGVLCTATLDNGEIYNAEFSFTVTDAPLYPTADYPTSNGPYRLDASI